MSNLDKKFVSIPPESMDADSLIEWLGKQFNRSAEYCQEAEAFYSTMKSHHSHLSELMAIMRELKGRNAPTGEIREVADTASEVLEAIKALSKQEEESSDAKDIDAVEAEYLNTEEGKSSSADLKIDIDKFLKNYTSYKSKLGLKTQQDVANLTGIDRRYISIIEGGKHKPQFKTLKRLADSFGIEVDQLIS